MELAPLDQQLLARMDDLRRRLDEVTAEMNDPSVASNPARLVELSREHARLRRLVEPYLDYTRLAREIDEHRALIDDSAADPDLRALAEEELPALLERRHALIEQMKDALTAGDDAAIGSIILEIRAGTGGEEAALFARDLFDMYQRFAERKRFAFEVIDAAPSDLGGFKEVIVNVRGPEVYRWFGYEGGGHRVQRVPVTESQGRIHTSAATVAVLPEPQELDIQIDWDRDVEEFVSRAGGPGGQNVNKVSSAIRLVHKATGITVSMRDEKSQHKNRAKARRILATRLYDHFLRQQRQQRDAARRSMIGSGDRSQRIRTYNFPQNRVTDHRIGMDLNLEQVLAGHLEPLIEALQIRDRQERIAQMLLP